MTRLVGDAERKRAKREVTGQDIPAAACLTVDPSIGDAEK